MISAQERRRLRSGSNAFALMLALAAMLFASGASRLLAQNASVAGTVLADSSEKRLALAEVSFPLLNRATRTDSAGNFRLTDIKPGRQRFRIRLLGYQPLESWLVVGANQKLEADFLLTPTSTKLATVHIKTDARTITTVRAQEFEENQRSAGHFIKADVFEKEQGRNLTNIIVSRVAGLSAVKTGGTQEFLASSRSGCFLQIILNNLVLYRAGLPPFDLNTLNSTDVIGLEVYTSAETPARYMGPGAGCGTLVIWTK